MAETFRDLLARGIERGEIPRLLRSKKLTQIRRGVYATDPDRSPEQRHLDLIEGTIPTLGKSSVLSHVSAAVLHDLPVPLTALARVHFTRVGASGRISRYAHRHGANLPSEVVTRIDGFDVTTLVRTVADLCRFLAYADGVAVIDASLRKNVSRDALADELAAGCRRPNNDRFRRALEFGDGLAESRGESLSRVLMVQLGLPMPVLQREFRDEEGQVRARTDFDWEDFGTVGEFDGEEKYGRMLKPGQRLEQVIRYEKRREELLRRHGRWVVRWTFGELTNRDAFRRMIQTGLEHGLRSAA